MILKLKTRLSEEKKTQLNSVSSGSEVQHNCLLVFTSLLLSELQTILFQV